MALKARIDSLSGLPEAVAKEYKEVKEGDVTYYVLDAEGVEDVAGLKSALAKERQGRSGYEKLVKKLGLKGDDKSDKDLLEKLGDRTIEELLDSTEKMNTTATEADNAVKASKKLQRDLDAANETATKQGAFLDKLVRENALKDVLAKEEHGGNATLLMPHLLKLTKTVVEDGADGPEYVARVIDSKTKEVRMKGAKEMSLDDLVAEVKAQPEFADAFKGTGASGSGSRPSRNPAGGGSGSRKEGSTPEAKRASSKGAYNQV